MLTDKNTAEIGNKQLDARDGYHDARHAGRLPRCDAVYYDAHGFERIASQGGPYKGCGKIDNE